jgi:Uma2 family endonuclease
MIQQPSPTNLTAEPTWDIAYLFPHQGAWSEEEYLNLDTNRLIEFSHGYLEVLPMPSPAHQRIVAHLYQICAQFILAQQLGELLFAPLRVQLWPGKYREPDLVFMAAEHDDRKLEKYWEGADLVMEIVSNDDRRRDTDVKRREYAQAGIPEYWLVDPQDETITVLYLAGQQYAVHGRFHKNDQATSRLLPGLLVNLSDIFT